MNKAAEQSIIAMLNAFPQTSQDYGVLLATLSKLLDGLSDAAIIETAERFASGDVKDQNKRFAPTAPEFVQEARQRQEFVEMRNKPRVASSPVAANFSDTPPFMVLMERAKADNADRAVIAQDCGYQKFVELSHKGQLPVGASYVAILGTIYGPRRSFA